MEPKNFLNFVFWSELSLLKFLWILDLFGFFYSYFPDFFLKISLILLKYVKTVINSTVDFISKDKKVMLTIMI